MPLMRQDSRVNGHHFSSLVRRQNKTLQVRVARHVNRGLEKARHLRRLSSDATEVFCAVCCLCTSPN
ncbi:hypothetical protein GQ55_7G262600 [Panicum hallii var. hallii]|uniref:Uncharacterized protein n=1 Tax=Panicum hallii var. hallii TaxID=1504633 RepID=A0A2T7CZ73_9POAL|nr:hypothetical protein GQ55_7G262600 [Panicum hallii var. hallii]